MQEKKCCRCHVVKSVQEFYKKSASKDGYRPECRACRFVPRAALAEAQSDFPNEEWRAVPGYEGYFAVSNLGRLKRVKSGRSTYPNRILTGRTVFGYTRVKLSKQGVKKEIYVHQLVARAFLPAIEGKPFINHKDGNKLNNRVENLEWVNTQENNQHAYDVGLKRRGETHHQSKLSAEEVRQIKIRLANGEKVSELAADFNVCHATVWQIQKGNNWKHIHP
jgi:hypothetical protein